MPSCSKCKKTKPVALFGMNKKWVRSICKACRSAQQKVYHKKHPEKVKAKAREYYENNRDRIRGKQAKAYQSSKGRAWVIVNAASKRAIKRGEPFGISVVFVELAIRNGFCQKTGIPFDLSPCSDSHINKFAPSLDRIDPFGFYVEDNVQVVVDMYNRGKGQNVDEEFIAFCKVVAARN